MNRRKLNREINRFKREFNLDDRDMKTREVKAFLDSVELTNTELVEYLKHYFKHLKGVKGFKAVIDTHENEGIAAFNNPNINQKFITVMCACIYAYKKGI